MVESNSMNKERYSGGISVSRKACADRAGRDLLHRFTPTPHGTDLVIMSRTVRLETNCIKALDSALEFFSRHQSAVPGNPEFRWRIVVQQDHVADKPGVALPGFSDDGLRFVNIGQSSFLAVDLNAREGVGFVSEGLVEGGPNLHCRSIFDTLFCMTAGSLGMVVLSAACVALEGNAILIFGPPASGKTTSSYCGAKLGLEFHADQAIFVEIQHGEVRVWGDLLPAIFRPEALHFLPELQASTREFSYPELAVCYLSKRPFQNQKAHSVTPVGCIFLERRAGSSCDFSLVSSEEMPLGLIESALFKDDERFATQSALIIRALGRLPAYHLAHSGDPAGVARLCHQMLSHDTAQNAIELQRAASLTSEPS